MRILGFCQKWPKLDNPEFTTFRFQRKDKDWYAGELVVIVIKPRSKDRQELGYAQIYAKEPRDLTGWDFTDEEAKTDGFSNRYEMLAWIQKSYGRRPLLEPMNKLTLRWITKF